MNTLIRLVEMILRGQNDKFKSVLQEELRERASVLLERIYQTESKKIFETIQAEVLTQQAKPNSTPIVPDKPKFIPESSYKLKDGNVGVFTAEEKELISKLHESLNNDNKERMVKLLSESLESFNRVLKLAKIHNKK